MNICIIGSGNVAFVVGRLSVKANHTLAGIIGRNKATGIALASELSTHYFTPTQPLPKADIYIVAVSDAAIPTIQQWLKIPTGILVHTSGTVSSMLLSGCSAAYGVLYPLQSLVKEQTNYATIPFLVHGNNPTTTETIRQFALTLSTHVIVADDDYRSKLHVAAVISTNFTNHLLALTNDFCVQETLDFSILLPLITETIQRLHHFKAAEMQTGPARRQDFSTINRHLERLANYPNIQPIYEMLTKSILQYYSTSNEDNFDPTK